MRRIIAAVVIGIFAGQAGAEGMSASPRPLPRPVVQAEIAVPMVDVALAALRPRARPQGLTLAEPAPQQQAEAVATPGKGLFGGFLRPKARPEGGVPVKAAVRVKPSRKATTSKKGSVCGDPDIKGEVMSPIKSKVKGCGVADPVRVTSVAGVRLSQAATIDCATAKALKRWVEGGLQPMLGRNGAVELTVAAHYICRSRNNVRGAKISEHGRGHAIDIAAVVLENGKSLTVARNFKTLRPAYKAACGVFGTTLGPGSDGYHEDHMHFDTAAQRNGPYCR